MKGKHQFFWLPPDQFYLVISRHFLSAPFATYNSVWLQPCKSKVPVIAVQDATLMIYLIIRADVSFSFFLSADMSRYR